MRSMMRLFTVVILSLFVTATYAQQRQVGAGMQQRTPEEMAKTETEWMMKELSLDKALEKPLSELQLKFMKRQAEMRPAAAAGGRGAGGAGGGNMEEMRERMQKFNEEKNAEIKKLIGEEKFKLYEKKVEERRAEMRRR